MSLTFTRLSKTQRLIILVAVLVCAIVSTPANAAPPDCGGTGQPLCGTVITPPATSMERPKRVYVLPVIWMPADDQLTTGPLLDLVSASMDYLLRRTETNFAAHLRVAQAKYRWMLRNPQTGAERGTFALATWDKAAGAARVFDPAVNSLRALVVRSSRTFDQLVPASAGVPDVLPAETDPRYQEISNANWERQKAVIAEVADAAGCKIQSCPFVFAMVVTQSDSGGEMYAQPFNYGPNGGSGYARFTLSAVARSNEDTTHSLQSTLLHELGHAFGLRHTNDAFPDPTPDFPPAPYADYNKPPPTGECGSALSFCATLHQSYCGGMSPLDKRYAFWCSPSIMAYTVNNQIHGCLAKDAEGFCAMPADETLVRNMNAGKPGRTEMVLIPENINHLAKNELVFPELAAEFDMLSDDCDSGVVATAGCTGDGVMRFHQGFAAPDEWAVPGHPRLKIWNGARIGFGLHGKTIPPRYADYDSRLMWKSKNVGADQWVGVSIVFPEPVALGRVNVETGYQNGTSAATTLVVDQATLTSTGSLVTSSNCPSTVLANGEGAHTMCAVASGTAAYVVWLLAGSTGEVVVRGIRLFDTNGVELEGPREPVAASEDGATDSMASSPEIVVGAERTIAPYDATFDNTTMWRSRTVGQGNWVWMNIRLPELTTLKAIVAYTGSSSQFDSALQIKVETRDGSGTYSLSADSLTEPAARVPFYGSRAATHLRIAFRAGPSGRITVRGIRFFTEEGEVFARRAVPAPFAVTWRAAEQGTPTTFVAQLSSTTTQLTWNFGDGTMPVAGTSPIHTYAAAGSYTVTVTGSLFCDANIPELCDTAERMTSVDVVIGPEIAITAPPTVMEGTRLVISFSLNASWSVSVPGGLSCGEGAELVSQRLESQTGTRYHGTMACRYLGGVNRLAVASVLATRAGVSFGKTASIQVQNVPPTVPTPAELTVPLGETSNLVIDVDDAPGETLMAAIDWGVFGGPQTLTNLNPGRISIPHVFSTPTIAGQPKQVVIKVYDEGAEPTTVTTMVNVVGPAPTSAGVEGPARVSVGKEGRENFTLTAEDPDGGLPTLLSATCGESGRVVSTASLGPSGNGRQFSLRCEFEAAGSSHISMTVQDDELRTSTFDKWVVVGEPPTGSIGGPSTVSEGSTVLFTVHGAATEGDPVVVESITCGAGSFAVNGQDTTDGPDYDMVFGCRFGNGAVPPTPTTIQAVLRDADGTRLVEWPISVANLPPAITAFSAPAFVPQHAAATVSGQAMDPGGDAISVRVNWGDGAIVTVAAANNAFSASHQWATPGSFDITVTPIDADGTPGTARTAAIVVRDTMAPVVVSVPPDVTLTQTSEAGAIYALPAATATDNVDPQPAIVVQGVPDGNLYPVGKTTIVTFTALDASGNVSEPRTTRVTVKYNTDASSNDPVNASATTTVSFGAISAPGFTTSTPIDPATAGALPGAFASALFAYQLTTSAGVTGPIVECFAVPESVDVVTFDTLRVLHGENGVLVDRTILAPDPLAPNFATRTICARTDSLSPFVIAARDVTPPTLRVDDVTVTGSNPAVPGAVAAFAPIAADNVGVAGLTCTRASGSTFPFGRTSVSCTAADAADNKTTVSFAVTVLDGIAPSVTYTGNTGSYGVDQSVDIRCRATDIGSTVASTTCADVQGPAYAFKLGANPYSATATDAAGNVGNGATSFTVTVSFTSLQALVTRLCTSADVAAGLNAKLAAAAKASNANARAGQLGAFANQVRAQTGKALTAGQADVLLRLVASLE